MLLNYLKVTLRSFANQKYYFAINTIGLALGLAACILILLYVQDERSYEKSFADHERIYRLVQDFPMGPHLSQSATVPFPTKNTLMADFPSITKAAFVYRPSSWGNPTLIRYGEDEYYEDDFVFMEPEFLQIYTLKFIHGDPTSALSGPNELVITESVAKKYFGNEPAIGKRLNLNGFVDLEVVAVISDLPPNTHLKFEMMASFATFRSFFNNQSFFDTQWVWVAAWLYFKVDDPIDVNRISEQLPNYVNAHYPAVLAEKGIALHIQRADDIHLHSNLELEFKPNGNIQHIYIFSSIALLILIIAIINFMNLATSRSAKRSKEVGLRKVMGAKKSMLISQFMGEAILTTFFALIVALLFISMAMPWYNQLTGKSMELALLYNPWIWPVILLLLMVVGIISGSYPALVLSSYQPTDVLKGKAVKSRGGAEMLRKALVVSQFVVSISLMICIGIVYKQLNYIREIDMGFDKDHIVLADVNFNQLKHYVPFKNTLESQPGIEAVSMLGGSIPGQAELIENAFVESGVPVEDQQWFSMFFAAHDFEKVLNLQFVQGHTFRPGNAADSTGFIINEETATALGWGDDVLGRSLDRINSTDGSIIQTGTVIGMVKDYNYRPLYDPIKPVVIALAQGANKMCIKIEGQNLNTTLANIESEWTKHFDGTPFRYTFMDMDYEKLYDKDEKLSQTVKYFSLLAIFIACLGLLGLSAYATENRKKEIGIRKVNGATTIELVSMLTADFSKLVLIAYLVSVPIAYFLGQLWLNGFAYKTHVGIWIYLLSGVAALSIAILTVSYHTIRVSMLNPVKSLRYE